MSQIAYRHPMLEHTEARQDTRSKEPIIPLATVIHEKKSGVDSRVYFQVANETLSELAPTWRLSQKALVTDREFSYDKVYIPNASHIYCSNHMKQNLMTRAQSLGSSKEEQKRIKNDFHWMLKSSSRERYEEKREQCFEDRAHWQKPGLQGRTRKPFNR